MIKLYPLKNEHQKIDNVIKIVVVGDTAGGKTNLLNVFTNSAVYCEEHHATIGVDFKSQIVKVNDSITKVQFWDTSGDERFRGIVSSYVRSVDGIIIVFDLTDPQCSNSVNNWLSIVNSLRRDETPIFLLGNKIDLLPHNRDPQAIAAGLSYRVVSAKTGVGVEEAFESFIKEIFPSKVDQVLCYGPRIVHEEPKSQKGEFRMKFEFPNIFSFFQTKKDPESTVESKVADVKAGLQELTQSTNPDLSTAPHQITRRRLSSVKEISVGFIQDLLQRNITVYENLTDKIAINVGLLSNYVEMRTRYGHCLLPVNELNSQSESIPPFITTETPFGVFLENFVSEDSSYASTHYLQQLDLHAHLPELIQDAGIQLFLPHVLSDGRISESECHEPTLFIGKKGIKTSLHFDRCGKAGYSSKSDPGKFNLFHQMSGKRRFILFPPELTDYFEPMENTDTPHVSKSTTFLHSVPADMGEEQQIDYLSRSPYPKLAEIWRKRREIILQPGETILISPRWWHCTELIESGTALNWWFNYSS